MYLDTLGFSPLGGSTALFQEIEVRLIFWYVYGIYRVAEYSLKLSCFAGFSILGYYVDLFVYHGCRIGDILSGEYFRRQPDGRGIISFADRMSANPQVGGADTFRRFLEASAAKRDP